MEVIIMNIPNRTSADITDVKVNKEFTYKDTPVLKLEVSYPQLNCRRNPESARRINRICKNYADCVCLFAQRQLYPEAIRGYKYSMENDFPFNAYETVLAYNVCSNESCIFSCYFDRYEYTSGAHGTTYRTSVNCNLYNGMVIQLSDICKSRYYRRRLLEQILEQADGNLALSPGIYFENYRELIVKHFSTSNFCITPEGLDIYYQQYAIAPYSTGIVVFSIPCDVPDQYFNR